MGSGVQKAQIRGTDQQFPDKTDDCYRHHTALVAAIRLNRGNDDGCHYPKFNNESASNYICDLSLSLTLVFVNGNN